MMLKRVIEQAAENYHLIACDRKSIKAVTLGDTYCRVG